MFVVHSGIPDAYNRKYNCTKYNCCKSTMYFCNNYTSYCKRLGSHNALRTLLTLDLYFGGPEDDSKRVETCRPKIIFYVIKLLCLTDTLCYICTVLLTLLSSVYLKYTIKKGQENWHRVQLEGTY